MAALSPDLRHAGIPDHRPVEQSLPTGGVLDRGGRTATVGPTRSDSRSVNPGSIKAHRDIGHITAIRAVLTHRATIRHRQQSQEHPELPST